MQHVRPISSVKIRSFAQTDAEVCKRLYMEGPIRGRIADNDTGLDIDNIPLAYMSSVDNHFWVAENMAGEVVGMIGVQQHESGEGEIRRLRVRLDARRRGFGSALLEAAIKFCKEKQHLKVTLDTAMDLEPAIRLFEKFRFKLSRKREISDRTMLYFYLDLYSGDPTRKIK
ncbi:MAG: GNAT family N-acetyltransferase [Planctomycetota bacterium]|nr:GNAT family N-acetyltransferase [Planctomycetota bacterium]